MAIFMNYTDIPGDVTAKGHETWIEISSFQFGVGRGVTSPTAGSKDREASDPSVSEIVVSKTSDTSSNKLMMAALQGEGVDVTIDFVRTDKGQLETYMQYKLNGVLVSGFSVSSGGDRPSESVSLNFTKISVTNTPGGDINETGTPDTVGWDLGAQAPL
jgi:type VI secretion system secreted protein Hcp